MCVSADLADFTGTTLYVGRRTHPEHGLVHVLGYQNTAVNLAAGPNAMLLHLPGVGLTSGNLVPVGRDIDFLDRIARACQPVTRGEIAFMSAAAPVQVFEHDIYTMVLAPDATRLLSTLDRVEPRKRPRLNEDLLAFYVDHYPAHTILLCCFDNAEAQRAKPLLLWYPPTDPDLLVAPALDCHTGAQPTPGSLVPVDHRVAFATDAAPPDWGRPVAHSPTMRHKLRQFLPDAVIGDHFQGLLPNGDFAITHDDLLAGDVGKVRRV
ncbi:hypothetical protein [Kutzneria sp. NPDC052558]|uniref:hypothetical protein n=1 Tax=Kutzneria sp. NPDC052558 TaxID=3364121 RepID=UPI0037C5D54C